METTLEVLRARKSGPEVHRRWPDEVKEGRRIYTHVNNTNPALMPDSEAAQRSRPPDGKLPMMAWRSSFEPEPEKEEWPLSREEFEARLRRVGEERYHDKHRFPDRLHGGACTMDEVQAWVINRWQYQCSIPMKDAAFLSRCPDPDLRRI
jgi:hypothetical protein